MKKPRNKRLGKRPRINNAKLKESIEGQNTYENFKEVPYRKSEKTNRAGIERRMR